MAKKTYNHQKNKKYYAEVTFAWATITFPNMEKEHFRKDRSHIKQKNYLSRMSIVEEKKKCLINKKEKLKTGYYKLQC